MKSRIYTIIGLIMLLVIGSGIITYTPRDTSHYVLTKVKITGGAYWVTIKEVARASTSTISEMMPATVVEIGRAQPRPDMQEGGDELLGRERPLGDADGPGGGYGEAVRPHPHVSSQLR